MSYGINTNWIEEHDLHLNVKSANHCCYQEDRSHALSTFTITVNDHPIEKVQSNKYLVVIIHPGAIMYLVCLPKL